MAWHGMAGLFGSLHTGPYWKQPMAASKAKQLFVEAQYMQKSSVFSRMRRREGVVWDSGVLSPNQNQEPGSTWADKWVPRSWAEDLGNGSSVRAAAKWEPVAARPPGGGQWTGRVGPTGFLMVWSACSPGWDGPASSQRWVEGLKIRNGIKCGRISAVTNTPLSGGSVSGLCTFKTKGSARPSLH